MYKLSVVVPIYNSEQYLKKCLESILNQTWKNLEVICVDDGSTDGSSFLCDQYAAKDARVKVIHKANGGLLSARKTGLNSATGDYVTFVDSDDWLDEDTYEKVFVATKGEEFDLVCYNLFMDRGTASQEIVSTVEVGIYDRDRIMSNIVPRMRWDFSKGKTGVIAPVVCKLFKKELLLCNMERLDYQITLCEDAAISYTYIFRCKNILVTDLNGYHYVQREGSMWHSYNVSSYEKILRYQKYMRKELVHLSKEYTDITPAVMTQFDEQQIQAIVRVVNNITRDVYDIGYNTIKWYPPYKQIPLNSRIVLYGAGDVGQAYYLKFYGDPNYKIVSWIDKKYQTKKGILAPESIMETDYDIVLIAVESEMLAMQIKENLVAMNVDMNRIVWQEPQPVLFSFGNK